jgi:hypothetical protein
MIMSYVFRSHPVFQAFPVSDAFTAVATLTACTSSTLLRVGVVVSSSFVTMDQVHQLRPQDLPSFLDPLLDYLAEQLPAPLYDSLFTFLSYALIVLSGLFKLVSAIPSYKPWEWDAQTILPPLIVFLSAYYVFISMYRTTTFFIRTAFRLIKWGTIFTILGAAYAWFTNGGGGDELNELFGNRRSDVNGGRSTARSRRARPKPWESFDTHQQWQYNEEQARQADADAQGSDMQRAVQYIAGVAGRAMGGSLLTNVKSFLDDTFEAAGERKRGEDGEGSTGSKKQSGRKAKSGNKQKARSR